MDSRSHHMTDPPEFGRPYQNFNTKHGSYTMEEWMTAQCPWLPLLFADNLCSDVLRPTTTKVAFGHLSRFATVHTAVFECGEGSWAQKKARRDAALRAARMELLSYAKIAEQVRQLRCEPGHVLCGLSVGAWCIVWCMQLV